MGRGAEESKNKCWESGNHYRICEPGGFLELGNYKLGPEKKKKVPYVIEDKSSGKIYLFEWTPYHIIGSNNFKVRLFNEYEERDPEYYGDIYLVHIEFNNYTGFSGIAIFEDDGKVLEKEIEEDLKCRILEDLRGKHERFLARIKEEINSAVEELKGLKNGEYWDILKGLNKALEPYGLHFGYRVVDEIALFYKAAKESWGKGIVGFKDDEVFDLAIVMKILPKFHGNRRKLEKPQFSSIWTISS